MAYELLFLPSLIRILQYLQIPPKILISTKYASKNALLISIETTLPAYDIPNILPRTPHSFR